MLTACYAIIRNEEPILPAFLDQIEALFDVAFVVDHSSTDSSPSLIRGRLKNSVNLFHLAADGYPQSEIATFFTRFIRQEVEPDFLFYLDADEFLPFRDRAHFQHELRLLPDVSMLRLQTVNICPVHLDGRNIFSERFLVGRRGRGLTKIALTRHADMAVVIHQGNHSASTAAGPALSSAPFHVPLYHVPVQSRIQITFKAIQGNNRLRFDDGKLKAGLGTHWVQLANQLADGIVSDEVLHRVALDYGDGGMRCTQRQEMEFPIPTVLSPYVETRSYVEAQARALCVRALRDPLRFEITDDSGTSLLQSP